nr:hypothetical protein [Tanacetum cinerariifolium]
MGHYGHFPSSFRVRKGFSGVEIPLFETMLAVRDIAEEVEAQIPAQGDDVQEHVIEEIAHEVVTPTPTSPSPSSPVIPSLPPHQSPCPPQPQAAEGSSHVFQQVLDTCSALVLRVEGLENENAAQQLEIVKLKARVKKLEKLNKVKSSKLRRLRKVGTSQRVESSVDDENVFNHGRISVDMETDEGIELIVVAASTPISAAKPKVLKIVAAPAISTRKRKRVVIRDPEEELHTDTLAETPTVKDKGKGILIEDLKPMKKKDQIEMDAEYAKKLQEELDKEHEEAYKQIDWNAVLDHVQAKEPQYIKRFHGIKKKPQSESEARKNIISYLKNTDEMEKEDEEIIKSINETLAQKAAKKRKLSEEAQKADDLKKRLEIVQDQDDDVFVEATLLAQKDPVVDYQSVHGLALVKRWKLLTSCGVHVIILSTVQLFLLVERRYPLSRFTLEQLVNVARLQVEEESEMSLELLRFTRQQLLEYQQR